MAVEGLEAYPALLAAFCGLLLVGRGRSRWLDHVRLGVMGLVLGIATAIQVGLVLAMGPGPAAAVGGFSLLGAFALAGLHLYGRLQRRPAADRLPDRAS